MAGIFSKFFSQKNGSGLQHADDTKRATILGIQETLEWMADFIARLSFGQISIDRDRSFLRTPNGMVGSPPNDFATIGEKCGLTIKAHRLFLACDTGNEGFMTVFDEFNDPKYVIFYNHKNDTYGKLDLDFEKQCSEGDKKTATLLAKNMESFLPTVMEKMQEAFPEVKEWQQ